PERETMMKKALTDEAQATSRAAGGGGINARALYEQDLQVFRATNGRDPDQTEQQAMMVKALETEAKARSTAAAPQLTGDLKQRTDQALARQNIDPLSATEAQPLGAEREWGRR